MRTIKDGVTKFIVNGIVCLTLAGYSGLGVRAQGPAAAETEAHDKKKTASGESDSSTMAVLRRRRAQYERSNVEDSSDSTVQSTQVTLRFSSPLCSWIRKKRIRVIKIQARLHLHQLQQKYITKIPTG